MKINEIERIVGAMNICQIAIRKIHDYSKNWFAEFMIHRMTFFTKFAICRKTFFTENLPVVGRLFYHIFIANLT